MIRNGTLPDPKKTKGHRCPFSHLVSIGVKLVSKGRPAYAERPHIRTYLPKNTSCFPKDYSSLNPDTHYKPFPVSASH